MPLSSPTRSALVSAGLEPLDDAPLAHRVYWRVGGPADALVHVTDSASLGAALNIATTHDCPVFVLGRGSNLLISDRGIRGLVLLLRGELADVAPDEEGLLVAGAGLQLTVLLARARRHGWTGLGCFAGIPGTVGGAIRMNAGSSLGETRDVLHDVDVIHSDGRAERLPVDALAMSYRTSHLPPGAWVARARLKTTDEDPDVSRARIRTFLDRRKATQPLNYPSCGSTFRNPPGDHAGRLIEAAGLKGFRIGDAQISEKHANFVVNLGSATASEIRRVIAHVQHVVDDRFGIELVREVHFVGEWDTDEG